MIIGYSRAGAAAPSVVPPGMAWRLPLSLAPDLPSKRLMPNLRRNDDGWLGIPHTAFDSTALQFTTLSGADLTVTHAFGGNGAARSTTAKTSGLIYWETTLTVVNGNLSGVGVMNATASYIDYGNGTSNVTGLYNTFGIYGNGSNSGLSLGALANGDIIGVALDFTNNKVWYRKAPSGNWNGQVIGSQNPATNTGGVSVSSMTGSGCRAVVYFNGDTSENFTANFGATAFTGTVPTGFVAWSPY